MNLEARCQNYKLEFPNYPSPSVGSDNRITGTWIIGNNYSNKRGYYGEYPRSYLKRIMTLFPDINKSRILHLFSGSIDLKKETTFDLNPTLKPDVLGDARYLSQYFRDRSFDLILADPPYANEDANRYGYPMINRNKVLNECYKILSKGGFVCWLDQVFPMFKKTQFELVGIITVIRSTNHRVRAVFLFKKYQESDIR